MVPPRRSSRLRSATPGKLNHYVSKQLGSLTEGDENSGTIPNTGVSLAYSPAPKTPVTASRIQPSPEEMHPSKAHQSTTQEPDSGLRLGFSDIRASGNNHLSGISQTPSKTVDSDPFFEIEVTRSELENGIEVRQMIDEIQGKAHQNSANLTSENGKKQKVVDSSNSKHERKLAHPKKRAGRFSDIHMAEFKKMDSIANHPSAFRVQQAQSAQSLSVRVNLKRSSTKAQLDEYETKTKKNTSINENGDDDDAPQHSKTLPSKRVRKHVTDDASTCRPASTDSQMPFAPKNSRPHLKIPSATTTPSRISVAQSSSKKFTSQIPRSSKSPSKSILHKASWGLTKSGPTSGTCGIPVPSKAAGSPVKLERAKTTVKFLETNSKFMKNPSTPFLAGNPKVNKAVNFTPKTIRKHAAAAKNSPSPMKSSIPQSNSEINSSAQPTTCESSIVNCDASRILFPSTGPIRDPGTPCRVEYPSLSGVHPLPQAAHCTSSQRRSPSPSKNFTFHSGQPIKFSCKTNGSEPSQRKTSHQLVDMIPEELSTNAEKNDLFLPSIPHGMSNKRRRRPDSEEEREEIIRSTKKIKSNIAGISTPRLRHANRTPTKVPSPAKKPVFLSLSRLNMLSRPKIRK